MFWSRPDVYLRCMDHEPLSNDDDSDGEVEDAEAADEQPSEEENGNNDVNDSNADSRADSNYDDDDDTSEDECSQAHSDVYYRFEVGDDIDAFWGGGRSTVPSWMDAIVVAIDSENDLYNVVWDFNSDKVG